MPRKRARPVWEGAVGKGPLRHLAGGLLHVTYGSERAGGGSSLPLLAKATSSGRPGGLPFQARRRTRPRSSQVEAKKPINLRIVSVARRCAWLSVRTSVEQDWTADGEPRPIDEAAVAEITGLLPAATLASYPPGTRVIVRRERPHPGAQPQRHRGTRRLPLHRLGHRHPRWPARLPRRPPPRPRPRRRPHPHRPRHRPWPAALQVLRHQRRVTDRHHDRGRPARLRPDPAPARHPVGFQKSA
jgi:hypothetical protein